MSNHQKDLEQVILKRSINLLIICFTILLPSFSSSIFAAIEAAANAPVYGNSDGLARVGLIESQINNMAIAQSHPRIILTPELVSRARSRVQANHPNWTTIKTRADSGSIVNAAFAYQMLKESNPSQALFYADKVVDFIKNDDAATWSIEQNRPEDSSNIKVGEWALSFDWVYDGISDQDRGLLIDKIKQKANLTNRAQWIRDGNIQQGETFHREKWIFFSWRAWPEIALAHHHPDAEFCYRSRWKYNWYWGDAARVYAYLADGTPLEGYQYGASGIGWFMALKSATGINLIDSKEFPYFKESADYQFYGIDFGKNRNIFHHGVGLGAAGCLSYSGGTNWKTREYHKRACQLIAHENPYQQWFLINILEGDATPWAITNEHYGRWNGIEEISQLLFFDPKSRSVNPKSATYDQFPYTRLFPGGNEVYMRTSWKDGAAMACFRSTPAFTKTSHGDYDVNTFLLYRKGVLSPDSGVYDHAWGQNNYFKYQKNTIAHNNILIIDPSRPDHPTKLAGSTPGSTPDPGGTENTTTRAFGYDYGYGIETAFVHNENAEWGDIVAFETNEHYDYSVGDAAKAYGDRCEEYLRHIVFIRRPNDKAFFVVFDRIRSTDAIYKKKWLLHLVTDPYIDGNIVNNEVPGHIVSYDGDIYTAKNVFDNSGLYGKILLPLQHTVRKVGGEGYRFFVEGSNPTNWGIDWVAISQDKEKFMGGPLEEIGQWRIELMPNTSQKQDYFLNVMYLGDSDEEMAQINLLDVDGQYGCKIMKDNFVSEIAFNKAGAVGGHIKIVENGITTVDKGFVNSESPVKSEISAPLNVRIENTTP